MKSRIEIKWNAREAISRQRATSILLLLVPAALGIALALVVWIPVIGWLASVAASLCFMVIGVGMVSGYAKLYRGERAAVDDLFSKFDKFGRNLGGMLWMGLFVFLWSLLLYIPGIVKAIAYSMTPYLLAECPNMRATDAIKVSMKMTNGYKGEIFVMYLSFIGWSILGALTFGILEIVYVGPYIQTTMAGYYIHLRQAALESGAVRPEELM